MMPSRYTAQMSLDDAQAQSRRMGVHYSVIPIEGMFAATLARWPVSSRAAPPIPPRRTSSHAAACCC